MKYPSKYLILALMVVTTFSYSENEAITSMESTIETAIYEQQDEQQFKVRVLLEERKNSERSYWEITSDEILLAVDCNNQNNRTLARGVRITPSPYGLHILDSKRREIVVTQAIKIMPKQGCIKLENGDGKSTQYQGSIFVIKEKDRTLLINSVDIEDYIYGVLKSESFPGWPDEINRALAIACRSYVISKVLEAQRADAWYHIKNTNAHQTYNGHHESAALKKVVEETKGIFLSYNNQPILAMYDICCGGVIPAKKKGINFAAAPYLARSYACTYCKSYKLYSWSVEYNSDELAQILKKEFKGMATIKEIKVAEKDDAGVVQKLLLKSNRGNHYLPSKKFYSCLKKVKSSCFSVYRQAQKIIFSGYGYGHHMGLCQWGARQMVTEGWDYKQILEYYYPGTKFMRLQAA